MSNNSEILDQFSQIWSNFWLARSVQERKFLSVAFVAVFAALIYMLLIAPALRGRAQLEKNLPILRQQTSELQAMSREAQALSTQAPANIPPMSKESLEAALTHRGITPQAVVMTGDFAKIQLTAVPFANLLSWMDETQKSQRISVLDANIVAQETAGMVNATLTLKQQRTE